MKTDGMNRRSLIFASLGSLDAAVVSAVAWAVVTVLTKYQIGYMAIGVGALVGFSVRYFGQGYGTVFRILAVAFSLLGCVLGNYLSQVGFYMAESGASFLDTALSLRPEQVPDILAESFSPMDVFFYALAAFEAWKLSVAPGEPPAVPRYSETSGPSPDADIDARPSFLFSYPPKKMLAAILPLLAILSVPVYVAANSRSTISDVYDSGAPKYEGSLNWNEPEGPWKYWYENGPLMAEVTYRKGLLEGPSVHYYEDGAVSERKEWELGFLHGPSVQYYPDGAVMAKGSYEYDRKTGAWEEYHPNGKMSASGEMRLDRAHGTWEYHSDSGVLVRRETYDAGEGAGIWETWSETGVLVLRREFKDGEESILYQKDGAREVVVDGTGRYVERHDNGSIATEGDVRNGKRIGIWRDRYASGNVKRVYEYRDGREHLKEYYREDGERIVTGGNGSLSGGEDSGGLVHATYKDGLLDGELRVLYGPDRPMSVSTYVAGVLNGPQKLYAPEGTLLTEGEFENGKQVGTWIWYNADGSVSSRVEFADGRKQGAQSFFENEKLVKEEIYDDGAYVETRITR